MKNKQVRKETSKVILIGGVLAILRWLPVNTYNRMFAGLVKTLNTEVMPMYAVDFVDIVKFSRKTSKKYNNSFSETESLLSLFPQFKSVKQMLNANVRINRKKFGLSL